MMMQFTATNTLIQAMVPDQLRGRVMSLYSMMFLGMTPIMLFSLVGVFTWITFYLSAAPFSLSITALSSLFFVYLEREQGERQRDYAPRHLQAHDPRPLDHCGTGMHVPGALARARQILHPEIAHPMREPRHLFHP